MNQPSNFFSEIDQKAKENKGEDDIDQKWITRNEEQKIKTSIEEIRSDLVGEEETLRKDKRKKMFEQMRHQRPVKHDTLTSLKDKLTISHELYEKCQALKPQVNLS
jgi:hypothetical protein